MSLEKWTTLDVERFKRVALHQLPTVILGTANTNIHVGPDFRRPKPSHSLGIAEQTDQKRSAKITSHGS